MTDARAWRRWIRGKWPDVYADGLACGFSGEYPGQRETGGYPKGFHDWPRDIRNAWFTGFNVGYTRRKQAEARHG